MATCLSAQSVTALHAHASGRFFVSSQPFVARYLARMDFTDEEIGQMLGERLHERSDLASHARAELSKVQPVSARNYNGEKAALFLARIGVLIQHIRSQLKHPSIFMAGGTGSAEAVIGLASEIARKTLKLL